MANASFYTKYKNLCITKPTLTYLNIDKSDLINTFNEFDLNNCEISCNDTSDCHFFFEDIDTRNCMLYSSTLSGGLDTYFSDASININCDNTHTLDEGYDIKGKHFYVKSNYHENNKSKFKYLNTQLKFANETNTILGNIYTMKKALVDKSDSRYALNDQYDNLHNKITDFKVRNDLCANMLNSHMVDASYSVDKYNNFSLDDEENLEYMEFINKLYEKINPEDTLKRQETVTKRSFTSKLIFYIILALVMVIAITTIIVYVMKPGLISDLTIGSLLIGLVILIYFLHFILKL